MVALEKDWCVPYSGSKMAGGGFEPGILGYWLGALAESLVAMVMNAVIWSRARRLRKSRSVRFHPHIQAVRTAKNIFSKTGFIR